MGTTYSEFLSALRERESSGNYQVVNAYGFLGAYQFGEAALVDLGFVNLDSNPYDNVFSAGFTGRLGVDSAQDFLHSPSAQDAAADDWFPLMWRYAVARGLDEYLGQTVAGIVITASGLLAGSHLLGSGAVGRFLSSGGTYNPADAFGTPISEYISMFSGYVMPFDTGETLVLSTPSDPGDMDQASRQISALGEYEIIRGGDGNDFIVGGDAADAIAGGSGDDILTGNGGNDVIAASDGNDTVHGNTGNDLLGGGSGDDRLYGDEGEDTIEAGDGADLIEAGDDDDVANGGAGNDNLVGDGGDDMLYGGLGDDIIYGDSRSQLLAASMKADSFVFSFNPESNPVAEVPALGSARRGAEQGTLKDSSADPGSVSNPLYDLSDESSMSVYPGHQYWACLDPGLFLI